MEVSSRRGVMFYGPLFAMTILCGGLGTLLVFVARAQKTMDYTLSGFALFLYLMGAYTIIKFAKNTPSVKLSDEGVRYKGVWYSWAEVTAANLTHQRPFPLLGDGKPVDAITLTFKEGREICIFDKMYWNGDKIRDYIQLRVSGELVIKSENYITELDEVTKGALKRKINWFTFFYVVIALPASFCMVFFDLPKGVNVLISILYNILFFAAFMKMFRRKENRNHNNGD